MARESHGLCDAVPGGTSIALARIKTWNPGDVLTAADLNAEFNNPLNNPIALVSPTTGAINFNLLAHTNLLPTAVSGTSGGGLPVGISLVRGLGGTASSQSITLNADMYALQTTAANFPTLFTLASTSAFTINVGTSGPAANGRDVAAVFNSTFVHCYAITTGAGSTTPAGIASSTPPPTGPVLPTNYSAWSYLTSLQYSTASTTISPSAQIRGNQVYYGVNQAILNAGAATSETTVSFSSMVPAIAESLTLSYISGAAVTSRIRFLSGNDIVASTVAGDRQTLPWTNTSSQGLLYLNDAAGGSVTLQILGYSVPNGGA